MRYIYKVHDRVRYKLHDTVNYLGRQYTVKSYKKRSIYGQPVYCIESILPIDGLHKKETDVPQSLLK